MIFSNKTYDLLKWVAQYLLPATGTLYFALSDIWGLPHGEQVVGTIVALNAFLGILLGISTAQYKKTDRSDGTLQIDELNPDRDIYRLSLNNELESLKDKSEVVLRVDPNADLSQQKRRL